jgi:hypothetical protein
MNLDFAAFEEKRTDGYAAALEARLRHMAPRSGPNSELRRM